MPKIFGVVQTDIGPGLCVELITDGDGSVSKTLSHLIGSSAVTPEVVSAIQELFAKLLALGVDIKDPGLSNIALQKTSDGQITAKVIDGIGIHTLIPISRWFTSIRKQNIQAKIDKISVRSGIPVV